MKSFKQKVFTQVELTVQYRKLGRTGLEISEISIGAEQLYKKSPNEIIKVVKKALDYGVNYFDIIYNMTELPPKYEPCTKDVRDRVALTHHIGSSFQEHNYKKRRSIKECQNNLRNSLKQ